MSWLVAKQKEGEPGFQLVGDGQRFHGRVHQGAMRADVFWGLKALEYPACREKVVHAWEIKAPRLYAGHDNAGPGRRFLCFWAPGAASFVLAFEEYVTPALLLALRQAYSGVAKTLHLPKEEKDHEDSHGEAVVDPAGARPERGQGDGGERAGHPAGHEQDPGNPGLEGRRQVVRRTAKTKKRAVKRRKS